MKRQRGITLIEIIIVITIILLLSAVAWMILGPKSKASAVESSARSDLKQCVAAIHIYMADNDGNLPLWPKSLPKGTPIRVQNFAMLAGNPDYFSPTGYGDIVLTRHYFAVLAERLYTPRYPWDEDKYPILMSPIKKEIRGAKRQVPYYSGCGKFVRLIPSGLAKALSAFMDGHTDWHPSPSDYSLENAYCVPTIISRYNNNEIQH